MEMTMTLTFDDRSTEVLQTINTMLQNLLLASLSIEDEDGYSISTLTQYPDGTENMSRSYGFDSVTLRAELDTQDGHCYQIDADWMDPEDEDYSADYIAQWRDRHPGRTVRTHTCMKYTNGRVVHLVLHHAMA